MKYGGIKMKLLVNAFPALVVLSFLTASTICVAYYETKSKFKTDYKCISDVQGGYNHKKDGHNFVEFNESEEFFLTHVSNVPISAVNKYLTKLKGITTEDLTIDMSRGLFEAFLMKVDEYGSGDDSIYLVEKDSYFIREPEDDPDNLSIYTLFGSCDTSFIELKSGETKSMSCYSDNTMSSFHFNINNGKFTYTYSGNWHQERKDPDYYGDSAIIAMGMCKPYYR